jgi:hypothetical protein
MTRHGTLWSLRARSNKPMNLTVAFGARRLSARR